MTFCACDSRLYAPVTVSPRATLHVPPTTLTLRVPLFPKPPLPPWFVFFCAVCARGTCTRSRDTICTCIQEVPILHPPPNASVKRLLTRAVPEHWPLLPDVIPVTKIHPSHRILVICARSKLQVIRFSSTWWSQRLLCGRITLAYPHLRSYKKILTLEPVIGRRPSEVGHVPLDVRND
jgi:hypothetical protein